MTRAFAPLDVPRLRALAGACASLDLEGDVLLQRSPLAHALAGLLGTGSHVTLVLAEGETGSPPGFVQARRHVDRAAADLVRIAPDLSANGAALAWQRLVTDACQRLAASGARRIYAALPAGDEVGLQVLQRTGFVPYATDVVFRLERLERLDRQDRHDGPDAEPYATLSHDPAAAHAAGRLAERTRTSQERAIEGPEGDWTTYPVGGHLARRARTGAVVDASGTVKGAWRVVDGGGGSWLRAVAADDASCGETVAAAAAAARRSPVWAAARAHQAGLDAALRRMGFAPVCERQLLVKHTTQRVVAPRWRERTASSAVPSPPVTPARSRRTEP